MNKQTAQRMLKVRFDRYYTIKKIMSYGKCNLPSLMIIKAAKTKNLIPIIMIYFSVVLCSISLCMCVE